MSEFANSSRRSGNNHKKLNIRKIDFRPLRNSSDDDESEELELLSRGTLKRRSPTVTVGNDAAYSAFSAPTPSAVTSSKFFIDHKLQPDDTVLSLSLRYRCSVADLKRLNGITTDQDLFALKVVKIPVSPFGALVEAPSPASDSNAPSPRSQGGSSPDEASAENDTRPERFFSKIDSSLQESFFWLAKKPVSAVTDEVGDSSAGPEVIISTAGQPPSSSSSGPQRSVTAVGRAPAQPEEVFATSRTAICLYISGFVIVFIALPLIYYLHFLSKEASHSHNNSSKLENPRPNNLTHM